MRIIELFAGIGACSTALKRLGINLEIVDAVEIDKFAIKSFNAIHGTNFDVQDICEWDKDFKDIDIITHGSPCQDFSVAGKQAGGDMGSGTRSSLMYETIRIVGKIRPKYVLWENVKNLLSKKHRHNFDAYIETMNILGYNSYYQVLNVKDYGIPQNRERVFTVSIRKDIDDGSFKFPEKEELKLRLKDMLEEEIDEKYYLNNAQVNRIKTTTYNVGKTRIQEKDYCDTLCARDWKDPKCVRVGGMYGQSTRWGLYDDKGLSPTLVAAMGEGGGYVPMVKRIGGIFDTNETEIKDIAFTQSTQCGSITSSSTVLKIEENLPGAYSRNFGSKGKIQDIEKECDTLQAAMGNGGGNIPIINNLRIRKLTPKECWRLMGFKDEEFEKAEKENSNTQLYKQAGNSIVVNVLEKIFKNINFL